MTQTVGYSSATRLKDLYRKLDEINDEIDDTISDLCGAEIKYGEHFYSMIDYIDGNDVYLYCESDDGEQYDLTITLDELIECL
ncbi:hypothetical protein D3C73_278800 [compost metagenome]